MKLQKANMKLTKLADSKKIPDGEQLALFVQTLKMYLKDNPSTEYADLIAKLPSPRQVRQDYSIQECKILYETIEYLWKRVTGQKVVSDTIKAPETLKGNYWLLNKGILLEGINHFDIAKKNMSLLCSLLDISPMVFMEYLSGHPNKLIHLIIRNGGIRLLIDQKKDLYAQMNSKVYGEYGRSKIKKLDFKNKVIKVIDLKAKYNGWKNGILVRL